MNIITKVINYIKRIGKSILKYHPDTVEALENWAKQFGKDLGSLAMQEAIKYGPKLVRKEITITQAKDEILADAKKRGQELTPEYTELLLNALRTLLPVK
jgi:hypothetical protein